MVHTFWKSCDGDESGSDHLMSNLTGEGADLLEVGRVVRIAVDQHLILIDCLHDIIIDIIDNTLAPLDRRRSVDTYY